MKFAVGEAIDVLDRTPRTHRAMFDGLSDELTGGGVPYGRFSIIWGPKSAGKTTLCYNLIHHHKIPLQ